jgi:hypothetical protein
MYTAMGCVNPPEAGVTFLVMVVGGSSGGLQERGAMSIAAMTRDITDRFSKCTLRSQRDNMALPR